MQAEKTADAVDVLLVDDDPNDAELSLRALNHPSSSLRSLWIPDGYAALALLDGWASKQSLPKVMFLDIHMPRISGMEVLQQLRRNEALRSLPVVMLSSSDAPADIHSCYALGANSYLIKASTPATLYETLRAAVAYWAHSNQTGR